MGRPEKLEAQMLAVVALILLQPDRVAQYLLTGQELYGVSAKILALRSVVVHSQDPNKQD